MYIKSVPTTMIDAEKRTRAKRRAVRIGAFFGFGGLRMMALSTGSTPRAWAGGPLSQGFLRKEQLRRGKGEQQKKVKKLSYRL
jgi:hypothetical protein